MNTNTLNFRFTLILLISVIVFSLAGSTYASPALPKTQANMSMLQFISEGHILGFASHGMYAASGNHALRVDFLEANPVQPHTDLIAKTNEKNTALDRVVYPELWDGITLEYTAQVGIIYTTTYYLHPSADPQDIRLLYNAPINLNENGSLNIIFDDISLTESAPIAWQDIEGVRIPVDVAFQVNGQEVSFDVGDYDLRYPLTIDPSLTWNTFLGGTGYDIGSDLVIDASGNIYVIGRSSGYCIGDCSTFSNPTWGNPKRAYGGGEGDGFVAKLNSSGSLVWNTFLGGSGFDDLNSIVIDGNGDIYVAGSSSISWGSPLQPFVGGDDNFIYTKDGFIGKLNSSGTLIWHTFLDGNRLEGIGLDNSGNIYVTGSSTAPWNIVDEPLSPHNGDRDVFTAKLTSAGSLDWYTFFGGEARDIPAEIVVDGGGNSYIVGTSEASWGDPVRGYSGSVRNAFVAKLDSSGFLAWNTFLGSGRDSGYGIEIDDIGNVYVVGASSSTWGSPIRAFVSPAPFPLNDFVAKLDTTGSLVWNTFLGSGQGESYGIDIDDKKHIYVVGADFSCSSWGNPFNLPSACGGGSVAKLDNYGNLLTNGFLGGNGTDEAIALYVKGEGDTYILGVSDESWGTPIRAFQKDFNYDTGDRDVFVARLDLTIPTLQVQSIVRTDVSPTNAANVDFTVTFSENVTGVDESDFNLMTSGVSGATLSEVNGLGSTYIVTVNTGSGDGMIRLDLLDDDSIVGSTLGYLGGTGASNGNFTGASYVIDKTAPEVSSIIQASASPSVLILVGYQVTFSEPVSGVDPSDFALSAIGISNASITSVSGSGVNRVVNVNTGVGSGTLRLEFVSNGTVQDVAGNSTILDFPDGEIYVINKPKIAAPVPRSPRSGGSLNNPTLTFHWQRVNKSQGYEIQFAVDNEFTNGLMTDTTSHTSYVPSSPFVDGIYYWRVRAYDVSGGAGLWSRTQTIILDTTGPTAPVLVSPVDEFISLNRAPTFRWQAVSGAAGYEFRYDNNADCQSPWYSVVLRTTSHKPPVMGVETYYWCVRARDRLGNWGDWSPSFVITITNP